MGKRVWGLMEKIWLLEIVGGAKNVRGNRTKTAAQLISRKISLYETFKEVRMWVETRNRSK